MVDIFGIKKDPEAADAAYEPAQGAGKKGSQKLWAVLLVIDSLFIIVFGGALAAKIYQHLKAPAIVVAPGVHRRPAVPAEAAKPAEAAAPAPTPKAAETAAAPKAPEPVKPPEPAVRAGSGPKAAKPSLLVESPRPREAPKPQAAAKSAEAARPAEPAAPADATGDKPRAVAVEFKLAAPQAKNVQLAGAFIVRGGKRDMNRRSDGTWALTLHLLPGQSYRYWFIVNGKKTLDPDNSDIQRGASLLTLP